MGEASTTRNVFQGYVCIYTFTNLALANRVYLTVFNYLLLFLWISNVKHKTAIQVKQKMKERESKRER